MGTASIHFDSWRPAWRQVWQKLAPRCGQSDCVHSRSVWRRLRRKPFGVMIQGSWYCMDGCLERALTEALRRVDSAAKQVAPSHRIPLGLLLLSRQQLTVEQLRQALEAQRVASRGRIGEWLQTLGFVNEEQVTAALARQWSCPILRADSLNSELRRAPRVPVALLKSFVMIPVGFVEATSTLHLAFGEGIDYNVLYAIERMVGCRTQPCMAAPSLLRKSLQGLTEHRAEGEVVFDRLADIAEFARIVRSYSARVSASEIRLASCGPKLWVRLLRRSGSPLDLLMLAS